MGYDKGLMYEYTRVKSGCLDSKGKKRISFSKDYFGASAPDSERNAIEVFRIAVEVFLRWSPEDCKERLNKDIVSAMSLDKPYKFLPFPPYLDRDTEYWYVAHILYPDRIPFDGNKITRDVYINILNDSKYKFPKKFFDSADGRERAGTCLRYYIEHYEVFHSIPDMYKYFASPEGRKALDNHGLRLVWTQVFGSPVRFLHESLDPQQRDDFEFYKNEFLYRYGLQQKILDKVKSKE